MELSNKAAYLQGLVDGLGVDESTKEGKIIKAMSALLAEMAEALEGMDEDLSRAYDQINDLSDELENLEADLYEDEDDDEDEGDEDEDDEDEAAKRMRMTPTTMTSPASPSMRWPAPTAARPCM